MADSPSRDPVIRGRPAPPEQDALKLLSRAHYVRFAFEQVAIVIWASLLLNDTSDSRRWQVAGLMVLEALVLTQFALPLVRRDRGQDRENGSAGKYQDPALAESSHRQSRDSPIHEDGEARSAAWRAAMLARTSFGVRLTARGPSGPREPDGRDRLNVVGHR